MPAAAGAAASVALHESYEWLLSSCLSLGARYAVVCRTALDSALIVALSASAYCAYLRLMAFHATVHVPGVKSSQRQWIILFILFSTTSL